MLCWSFYYINNNEKVDNQAPQLTICHVCYPNLIIVANSIIFLKKGIISYFKTYARIFFYKHMDEDHVMLAKKFEEEV